MRSHDGTVATAHEVYVDGRLFVSADELERQIAVRSTSPAAPLSPPTIGDTIEVRDVVGGAWRVHTVQADDHDMIRDRPELWRRFERPWFCWAIRPRGTGWEWARVLLPDAVVAEHTVGQRHTPDTRGIVIARIENDMRSDAVSTGRRWGQ